jgi:hypothetical protein
VSEAVVETFTAADEELIYPGDTVEIGVTHEIKIGRESAWIKAGVSTKVRPGESPDEAGERAIRYVNTQVINSIVKAVDTVQSFEKGASR